MVSHLLGVQVMAPGVACYDWNKGSALVSGGYLVTVGPASRGNGSPVLLVHAEDRMRTAGDALEVKVVSATISKNVLMHYMLGEPITLKIKTMIYGQNWSRCRPHNAVSTVLPFIMRNLFPLCYESRYIPDALTYQSDIHSPLQSHPTFTLLQNVILISAPIL